MSDVSQIDGNAVRLRRESQGWALSDLATRACLSVKQVRQIEEGGMTAFYSETVKLTAARKLANLLDMTEGQLFGQHTIQLEHLTDPDHEEVFADQAQLGDRAHFSQQVGGLNAQSNPFTRSEALHILAQPPEHLELQEPDVAVEEPPELEQLAPQGSPPSSSELQTAALSSVQTTATEAEAPAQIPSADPAQAANNSGYFLKILALFLVALAAAALLKPANMDEKSPPSVPETSVAPVPPVLNSPAESTSTAPASTPSEMNAMETKSPANGVVNKTDQGGATKPTTAPAPAGQ